MVGAGGRRQLIQSLLVSHRFTIEPAMTGLPLSPPPERLKPHRRADLPFAAGVASICSQSFYAWRVYVVSKRPPWIPCVTMFLSLVALGFSVGATGQIYHLDSQFALFSTWRYGVSTCELLRPRSGGVADLRSAGLASAAAADVLITGALVYYLHKSGSTFVITSSIVDKIISNVISTNGLTACVALGDTILFAALDTSEHVIPQLCLVKLYFNSLLVSRESLFPARRSGEPAPFPVTFTASS